jgi:hypothetical protein
MQKLHMKSSAILRAEADMDYLGKAWRLGYYGPAHKPQSTSIWQQIKQQIIRLPVYIDEERVDHIYARWLALFVSDAYNATLLKVHFRDGVEFEKEELFTALQAFCRT